jgi:hypothetical protein
MTDVDHDITCNTTTFLLSALTVVPSTLDVLPSLLALCLPRRCGRLLPSATRIMIVGGIGLLVFGACCWCGVCWLIPFSVSGQWSVGGRLLC